MKSVRKEYEVDGERLIAYEDKLTKSAIGNVILLPPFGMSGERMKPASLIFRRNGFNVVRVDPRYHPGESTGSILDFRVEKQQKDIESLISAYPESVILTMSLSTRPVFRAAAKTNVNIKGIIALTPVVDIRYTLDKVFGYDLFKMKWNGEVTPEIVAPLGYDVKTTFIDGCIENGMVDVHDFVDDLSEVKAEKIVFIAGDMDPWVSIHDLENIMGSASQQISLVKLVAATHQLYRNPVIAMSFLHESANQAKHLFSLDSDDYEEVKFYEIVNEIEYDRA